MSTYVYLSLNTIGTLDISWENAISYICVSAKQSIPKSLTAFLLYRSAMNQND